MKRLLLVLAACSSKSSAPPPPAQGPAVEKPAPKKQPVLEPPTMKSSKPIDLTDAGITELQLVPTEPPVGARSGELDILWRSEKAIEAGVVCRVESYNLFGAGTHSIEQALPKGQHAVMWSPAPFVIEPDACEVRFLDAKGATFASACYRAGNMTAGPCPAGTFTPPKLDPGQVMNIQGATVTAFEGGIRVKALYTVAAPLPNVSFDATCDGVKTKTATAEESFIPLAKLRPGETTFAPDLLLHVDKPITKERPDKCELRASQNGKRIGTFCIAEGSTNPGPCE
jgi:hypothetical protein